MAVLSPLISAGHSFSSSFRPPRLHNLHHGVAPVRAVWRHTAGALGRPSGGRSAFVAPERVESRSAGTRRAHLRYESIACLDLGDHRSGSRPEELLVGPTQ
jgi:hypothetical protein